MGIPIDPKFSLKLDCRPIAAKLGLDLSLPVVLVMGGGHGLGPIKNTIKSLDSLGINMQIIVVAGINRKLLAWVETHKRHLKNKIIAYPFVDNIDELMELATFLITKPGGITTAEALAKGLPMIIIKPIPGQEINNTEFLLKKGAAIRINTEDELKSVAAHLLENREKLGIFKKRAKELARPSSSLDIAKFVLELC